MCEARLAGRAAWTVLLVLLHAGIAQAHAPSIGLSQRYVNFVVVPGGPTPSLQLVVLSNTTHGRMAWSTTVSTASGGGWLSVSPPGGLLPGDREFETAALSIAMAPGALPVGVYYGVITLSAPGDQLSPAADNTPQTIEVALTISNDGQPAPGIGLSVSVLGFEGVAGREASASQTVRVTNLGGGSLNWTAVASTTGGNWLSVTPAGGLNAGTVTVTARPTELAVGSYAGRITFTAVGAANSPRTVPVSLRVRDPLPPSLRVNLGAVSFSATLGSPNPASQRLEITNAGDGALQWRASAVSFNGGPWLAISPDAGANAGTVMVSADTAGLQPGNYAGRITVTADGALNSPVPVPVFLTVERPRPTVGRNGVVNAASYTTLVAAGGIASVFGSNLGPRDGVTFTLDRSQKLPTTLAGTRITFDGVPAPLFYVSFRQVNLQIPYEMAGRDSARMVVNVEGIDPATVDVALVAAAPAVFTVDGLQAAALNQDFTVNGPDNPAAPGSVIQLFLTGQGPVRPPVETGALAPSEPLSLVTLPVAVRMQGFEATKVPYAGLAPGFAGLMQLNVEIPPFVIPTNELRVTVSIAREPAASFTIAVR